MFGISLIEKRHLSTNTKNKITIGATNHLVKIITNKKSKGYNLVEIKKD